MVDGGRVEAGAREDGGADCQRERAQLLPRELLVLYLAARGYSPAQVARMVEQPPVGAATLLALAAAHLGAADVPGAVREAKRRGLIT